jgi:hypothetical protein
MHKFLTTIFRAFVIPLVVCVAIFLIPLFFLPVTPRASGSYLFGSMQKDSMMQHTPAPRIVFVGGSNLSQGLNSQIIRDSLKMNPVNTSITGFLGLIYMMDNSSQYVQRGDIVVLVPEYNQFYDDKAYGSEGEDLTRLIFDVDRSKLKLMHFKQLLNIVPRLPAYVGSKFEPSAYTDVPAAGAGSPFNQYGDDYKSRSKKPSPFDPWKSCGDNFDGGIIDKIKNYEIKLRQKGARLYLSYPGYQQKSFLYCKDQIKVIEQLYVKYHFNTIGKPENYVFPDSLMAGYNYHLNAAGQVIRTKIFIRDYKVEIGKQ